MTTFHTINPTTEIALKKPITFEHGRAFYENPLAIAEGDPSAPKIACAGLTPSGGSPQNALATDETDQAKRLAPDGVGGVAWQLPFAGVTTAHDAGGLDHIQTVDLNVGTWHVVAKAFDSSGSCFANGDCEIKNGAIDAQKTLCVGHGSTRFTSNIDTAAFAMSGSGATLRVTFAPTVLSGTLDTFDLYAVRVA